MSTRDDALAEIALLATRHGLSLQDISRALDATNSTDTGAAKQKSILSRLFSYIGGILMFSGLCVFIGMFWDDFSPLFRVFITFGSGVCFFIAAFSCIKKPALHSLFSPLLLASSALQCGGMFVALDEYGSGGDARIAVLMVSLAMLFQYCAAFIALREEILAWLAMIAGGFAFAVTGDLLGISENMISLALGFSYLCLATALADKISVRHSGFWYMVGAILTLSGFYDMVRATVYEVAFPGLCALLIYLSIVVKSRSLLALSALAMIWYIGDFAFDAFANNGLFPLGLIAAGAVFMGLGSAAMRLDRRFLRPE